MICESCRYADEYLCWWWYPWFDPTCLKGHSIGGDECSDFELIGRYGR